MKLFLNTANNFCRENILYIGVMLLALVAIYTFLGTQAEASSGHKVLIEPFEAENQSYDFDIGISEDKFVHAYTVVEYN